MNSIEELSQRIRNHIDQNPNLKQRNGLLTANTLPPMRRIILKKMGSYALLMKIARIAKVARR
jgi:hypothetical protein